MRQAAEVVLAAALLAAAGCAGAPPSPPPLPTPQPAFELRELPVTTFAWRPFEGGPGGLGPALSRAAGVLRANGAVPAGPPFLVFLGRGRVALAVPVADRPALPAPWALKATPEATAAVFEVPLPLGASAEANDRVLETVRTAGRVPQGLLVHRPRAGGGTEILVPLQP